MYSPHELVIFPLDVFSCLVRLHASNLAIWSFTKYHKDIMQCSVTVCTVYMAAFTLSRDVGREVINATECCADAFVLPSLFRDSKFFFFSYFELLLTDDKFKTAAKNWHLL